MKRLLSLALIFAPLALSAADFRGSQFIGYDDFSDFKNQDGALTSRIIDPALSWNELVISWNLVGRGEIRVEARVIYPYSATGFYQFGVWSATDRHSVTNQADRFGEVKTDTLVLKELGGKIQARLILNAATPEQLKYLAFSFQNSKAKPEPLPPNRSAWGQVVEIQPRSQLEFPEGAKNWCSPTSSSMILDFWARKLNRPELSLSVPEVAKAVYDPNWPGTGNWPFNTALIGHFSGLRSYVSRLTDVSEIEDWIAAGFPIAASVSYNRLQGKGIAGSGHLIVCVGFDDHGDIIVNDPGTRLENARRTFSRDLFRQAWADSGNTVYIAYPPTARIPVATRGHWE